MEGTGRNYEKRSMSSTVVINYTSKRNATTEWNCRHCTTVNLPELVNCQTCLKRRAGLPKLTAEDLQLPDLPNAKQNNFTGKLKGFIQWKGKFTWDCPQCTLKIQGYHKVCTACGTPMPPDIPRKSYQDKPSHLNISSKKDPLNKRDAPKGSTSGKSGKKSSSTPAKSRSSTKLSSSQSKSGSSESQHVDKLISSYEIISPSECQEDTDALLLTPTIPSMSPCSLLHPPPSVRHPFLKRLMSSKTTSSPSLQANSPSNHNNSSHINGSFVSRTNQNVVCPTHAAQHLSYTHAHPFDWVCPFCGILNLTIPQTHMCYVCGIGRCPYDRRTPADILAPVAPRQAQVPPVAMETVLVSSNEQLDPPTSNSDTLSAPDSPPLSPGYFTFQGNTHHIPRLGPGSRPTHMHSDWGQGSECPCPHGDKGLPSPRCEGLCSATPLIHSVRIDHAAQADQLYQDIRAYCQQVCVCAGTKLVV